MGTRQLLRLLKEHDAWCKRQLKLKLATQDDSDSLVHFTIWLEHIWLPQDDTRRKRITESIKKGKS